MMLIRIFCFFKSADDENDYLNSNNIKMDNKDDISDVVIVDSPNKHILGISEQMRITKAKHHSKSVETVWHWNFLTLQSV